MKDLVLPFETSNYKEIVWHVSKMLGSSAYVGASRLYYVCYLIIEHYYGKRYDKMIEYYPSLIEAAIEFKVYN